MSSLLDIGGAMIPVPDKCLNCDHTIVQIEDVHQGWCKYQLETVIRCGCDPLHHRVGCVSAEMYCVIKKEINNER